MQQLFVTHYAQMTHKSMSLPASFYILKEKHNSWKSPQTENATKIDSSEEKALTVCSSTDNITTMLQPYQISRRAQRENLTEQCR